MTPRLSLRSYLSLAAALLLCPSSHAQISLTTAIDLALRNSPHIQVADADVARATAALSETRDAYIPSATVGGSGYGRSYGYPLGQPTAVTVQAQSLVFSFSQRDYVRSAHNALTAASLSLQEAQESVAEDVLLTWVALDRDTRRLKALDQQESDASRLIGIIQSRLDVGQDTQLDLTTSQLTRAQIHLRLLQAQDDTAVDRTHLAHLTGLPATGLAIAPDSLPALPAPSSPAPSGSPLSPAIRSLYANAQAKSEQAFGDARYLYRPQISFAAQYSAISTFSNPSFYEYFGRRNPSGELLPYPSYAVGAGVQLNIPILDYAHRARARETAAEASHALHQADEQRDQFLESRLRTARNAVELQARAEIARLDQQLAQQQLDVTRTQLLAGGSATPATPKDEQNARITERDKYLALVDAQYELNQASISLLRQAGELAPWLRSLHLPAPPQHTTATPLRLTPAPAMVLSPQPAPSSR